METILSIKNLNKKFKNIHAVRNLSFEVEKGNVYGLLGPNGSGKSTTLGIILNVINPDSGEFVWFGGAYQHHEALKKVGALIERPNFYPYMTARQNLELVCKIKETPFDRIEPMLKLVNLYERRDSKFKTFSLGMKQRLAIASALLNRPEILILDEPTNGLDPQGINEIRNIILRIAAEGTTILLASHILDEVEKVCSHVIVLQQGEKIFGGRIEDMQLTRSYLEIETDASAEQTAEVLKKMKEVNQTVISGENLHVFIQKGTDPVAINRFLYENGIVIRFIRERKPNLEEQFLSITRQQS